MRCISMGIKISYPIYIPTTLFLCFLFASFFVYLNLLHIVCIFNDFGADLSHLPFI